MNPPPRAPGTALHRQLFMVLRDEIERGLYAASGALPKEEALCQRFQVSRITVRRALADLAGLGLVERRHGLGTFVRSLPWAARETPSLGFVDSLRQVATETQVAVLKVERVAAPLNVATALQLDPGATAAHAVRLRSIDGVPVMYTEAWVPSQWSQHVTASRLRKLPLYRVLEQEGVSFGRVVQEITAQVAPPEVAGPLQAEVGAPLLKLVRVMHDTRARPVLHLTALLPPDRSRILMDIPGDKVNTLDAGHIVHDAGVRIP